MAGKKKGRRRLPPASGPQANLAGVTLEGYVVGSWCPTPNPANSKPEAVSVELQVKLGGQPVSFFLRLKTPHAVDEMIQALLRHKRDVWPDSQ